MTQMTEKAGRCGLVLLALLAASPVWSLTLDQRVSAQRALEEVTWRHRIWPSENPQPKPALSAVLPDSEIRSRVEDSLRKSDALEKIWGRPLSASQLQAELDRLARDTNDVARLREMYAALGNDPVLIAECLARPILAERLVRSWFAGDERFQGAERSRLRTLVPRIRTIADLKSAGGLYQEVAYRPGGDDAIDAAQPPDVVMLDAEQWRDLVAFREEVPVGELVPVRSGRAGFSREYLVESQTAFEVTMMLARSGAEVRVATVSWPKRSFEDWWRAEFTRMSVDIEVPPATYRAALPSATSCVNDTWKPTAYGGPTSRFGHVAVWTGSEMIVWGGLGGNGFSNPYTLTGGRYNPATDTWTPTAISCQTPPAVSEPTAVWTGTEMIVFGGEFFGSRATTGGRYNPLTDSWTLLSTIAANHPGQRLYHTAIWTGAEMIIWGGQTAGAYTQTGARYNPSSDSWSPTNLVGAPPGRQQHSAVWTNGKMLVWGGFDGLNPLNSGGGYNPLTDSWTSTSTTGAPAARWLHSAVWTGSEMIVWGGDNGTQNLNSGGRYKPSNNTWTALPTTAAPSARTYHAVVWTGTQMIVWGGIPSGATGARYTPSSNSWAVLPAGGPTEGAAVWTGTEMIAWNGVVGGRYNPSANTWIPTNSLAVIVRGGPSFVWTGTEMLVWGPSNNLGQLYDPATDSWRNMSLLNAPAPRGANSAIWTGTEFLVWGGELNQPCCLNSGGRYSPATDTWLPIPVTAQTPPGRTLHSGIWTGTEMIIWGGSEQTYPYSSVGTGARFDPATGVWMPLAAGGTSPSPRVGHTAIWTGSEMIVWGGSLNATTSTVYYDSGARYDPEGDSWASLSLTPTTPSARAFHKAIWTGQWMIVWGGNSGPAGRSQIGAIYDPAQDSWTPTGVTPQTPTGRIRHALVWSGREMLAWGGQSGVPGCGWDDYARGGRYDPGADTWMATNSFQAPTAREDPAYVWAGNGMLIWGGKEGDFLNSGAFYCASPCTTPTSFPILTGTSSAILQAKFSWSSDTQATTYDLVKGDLGVLHSSGGNFAQATTACLAGASTAYNATDPAMPSAGGGFWYLVRPVNCAAGSYDTGSGSQVGLRDAEIAASGNGCP